MGAACSVACCTDDDVRPKDLKPVAPAVAPVTFESTEISAQEKVVHVHERGFVYEGTVLSGKRHGKGKLVWPDGRTYDGAFVEGQFHGMAVMKWPDGRTYTGQYNRGKKDGHGVFQWPDGRQYDGEWVDGKREGKGMYTNRAGVAKYTIWKDDKPMEMAGKA